MSQERAVEKKLAMPSPVVTAYPALLDETWHFFLLFHWRGANMTGKPTLHVCDRAEEESKMEDALCSERD